MDDAPDESHVLLSEVRITRALLDQLVDLAERADMTVHQYVARVLAEHVLTQLS
jgi:predicted DNA-binding ribbon-helix-helix protein